MWLPSQVLQLCPRLAAVAAQLQGEGADAHAHASDDEETARGMARLFIDAGETYTDMLASGTYQSLWLHAEAFYPVAVLLHQVPSHALVYYVC